MNIAGDVLSCVYCEQLITADDAQRISRDEVAHTACAFAADEACFAALDAEQASKVSDDDAA